MRKEIKLIAVSVCAFALGLGINNIAISSVMNYKIAVVDVQKVVAGSAQVRSLKLDQQSKLKDLKIFVENAKKDIAAQKKNSDKKTLEEKYNKELQEKTSAIDKEYSQKLKDLDTDISGRIANEAKTKNYNIVLSKGVVLYGGEDITESIMKAVK